MKECFFCFEQMLDQEYVCKHCKHWQPSQSEIDKQYKKAIGSLIISQIDAAFWGKVISRGIFIVALINVMDLLAKVWSTIEASGVIARLIELIIRPIAIVLKWQRQDWIDVLVMLTVVTILSAGFELLNLSNRVGEDKYSIERALRYQLQSTPTSTWHIHLLTASIIILTAILLLR